MLFVELVGRVAFLCALLLCGVSCCVRCDVCVVSRCALRVLCVSCVLQFIVRCGVVYERCGLCVSRLYCMLRRVCVERFVCCACWFLVWGCVVCVLCLACVVVLCVGCGVCGLRCVLLCVVMCANGIELRM